MLKSNLNILIAEDDFVLRDFITKFFKLKNTAKIYHANTGLRALDIFEKNPVNFIICDLNMPGKTGLYVLNKIRSRPDIRSEVPFIMITVNKERSKILASGKAGVDSYLVKPFKISVLEERVNEVLLRKNPGEIIPSAYYDLMTYNFENAYKKLHRLHEVDPWNKYVKPGLIIASSELNRLDIAENYFSDIIDDQKSKLNLFAAGVFSLAKNNFESAINSFKTCCDLDPDFVKARIYLAKALIFQHKNQEAFEVLQSIDQLSVKYRQDLKKIDELLNLSCPELDAPFLYFETGQ